MTEQVDLFDHHKEEPADRYHPEHDTFRQWLDAEAPVDQAQKLRNRSRYWPEPKPVDE